MVHIQLYICNSANLHITYIQYIPFKTIHIFIRKEMFFLHETGVGEVYNDSSSRVEYETSSNSCSCSQYKVSQMKPPLFVNWIIFFLETESLFRQTGSHFWETSDACFLEFLVISRLKFHFLPTWCMVQYALESISIKKLTVLLN